MAAQNGALTASGVSVGFGSQSLITHLASQASQEPGMIIDFDRLPGEIQNELYELWLVSDVPIEVTLCRNKTVSAMQAAHGHASYRRGCSACEALKDQKYDLRMTVSTEDEYVPRKDELKDYLNLGVFRASNQQRGDALSYFVFKNKFVASSPTACRKFLRSMGPNPSKFVTNLEIKCKCTVTDFMQLDQLKNMNMLESLKLDLDNPALSDGRTKCAEFIWKLSRSFIYGIDQCSDCGRSGGICACRSNNRLARFNTLSWTCKAYGNLVADPPTRRTVMAEWADEAKGDKETYFKPEVDITDHKRKIIEEAQEKAREKVRKLRNN